MLGIALLLGMRHIQYQGETLPPFPLVLAFHLVLEKFLTYILTRVETTDETPSPPSVLKPLVKSPNKIEHSSIL